MHRNEELLLYTSCYFGFEFEEREDVKRRQELKVLQPLDICSLLS